jgi:hypothetical protein
VITQWFFFPFPVGAMKLIARVQLITLHFTVCFLMLFCAGTKGGYFTSVHWSFPSFPSPFLSLQNKRMALTYLQVLCWGTLSTDWDVMPLCSLVKVCHCYWEQNRLAPSLGSKIKRCKQEASRACSQCFQNTVELLGYYPNITYHKIVLFILRVPYLKTWSDNILN